MHDQIESLGGASLGSARTLLMRQALVDLQRPRRLAGMSSLVKIWITRLPPPCRIGWPPPRLITSITRCRPD